MLFWQFSITGFVLSIAIGLSFDAIWGGQVVSNKHLIGFFAGSIVVIFAAGGWVADMLAAKIDKAQMDIIARINSVASIMINEQNKR